MAIPQPAVQFLLQVSVILIACRVAGAVLARLGQPKVVGEMIAGILLELLDMFVVGTRLRRDFGAEVPDATGVAVS
jgi:Kef-type K+ transport system membrane component KefB